MKIRFAIVFVTALLGPALSDAHDTWILPIATGSGANALALTSGMAFPQAETAIKPARVASAAVLLDAGKSRVLTRFEPAPDHLRIVVDSGDTSAQAYLSLHPNTLALDAENVAEYLPELGDTGPLRAQYEKDGRWRERYVKHAKALPGEPSVVWFQSTGAALELVLQGSAAGIRPGQVIRVQLLAQGKALPNHRVGMASAGASGHVFAQTDAQGVAEFALPSSGAVLLTSIQIAHVDAPDREWDSDFATLTFSLPR